jgi:hypothetical protein
LASQLPDYIAKAVDEKKKAFADYDAQRHAAYHLDIQLSSGYSSSTIIVNALTIAKTIPFCIFAIWAVVLILDFQQSAYKRQLRVLVRKKTGNDLSEVMTETQFFAAPLDRDPSRPEKYLAMSPVDLAIVGGLGVALILLTVRIVSSFLLNLVQLTDSIVSGYPFALYVSLILLVGVIIITHKSYAEFFEPKSEDKKYNSAWQPSRASKWLTLIAALTACISIAFPWVTEGTGYGKFFRGFEFLLAQRPTGKLLNYTTYAFSPAIFRDVRIQITIALAFLAVCLLDALVGFSRTKRLALPLPLHQVRRLLAACVFVLSTYYVWYMAFLQYKSVHWVPWLDKAGYQGPPGAKGYSMLWYNPAYGFWIFLLCCWFLIWLSLATKTKRLNTWIRQLTDAAALKWKPLAGNSRSERNKSDLPSPGRDDK